jgi:hypothetical protein
MWRTLVLVVAGCSPGVSGHDSPDASTVDGRGEQSGDASETSGTGT